MKKTQQKEQRIARRHKKIRAKISGSSSCPRLAVFKSNQYIYAQLIDDDKNVTLASSTSQASKAKTKTLGAIEVGKDLAKKAVALKIKKVVFDRGGFIYIGRVKALADAAREGGLTF